MSVTIHHLGCIGHFAMADRCLFRRHTQIDGARIDGAPGGFCISTVGDLYPDGKGKLAGRRATLGADPDSWYETYVFATTAEERSREGCGCRVKTAYSEIEGVRAATPGDANANHDRLVAKYARKARAQ